MKKLVILAFSSALLLSAQVNAQTDAQPPKPAKIGQCIGCHGAGGNSVVPTFPKLAGQHASYTEKQLKDFRDGYRKNATMAPFAKGLTDQEIKDIAAYYAAQ